MPLLLADTFTSSLAKLTNDEQKAVKLTCFDLQSDPKQPGLRYHKLKQVRDERFVSVSPNMDLRLIIHRSGDSLLACYVDHHDKAYRWAQNRKVETHPTTGAAQIVEVVETVRTVEQIQYVQREVVDEREVTRVLAQADLQQPANYPLAEYDGSWLMQYGVPEIWVEPLRHATQDGILDLFEHLPQEAAEAVLSIATGANPPIPVRQPEASNPFTHPDALRRFRTVDNREELEAALELPFDKWRIFLHPAQRELVGKAYSGPARVAGSAGTGKTIVALHRTTHIAREDDGAYVLLTTFSDALANALQRGLRALLRSEPILGEQIYVSSLRSVAQKLFAAHGDGREAITLAGLRPYVEQAAGELAPQFGGGFVWQEFVSVVDGWQVFSWEDYRSVPRVGRGKSLNEKKRRELWAVFEAVLERVRDAGQVTDNGMFAYLTEHFRKTENRSPYTHVVIDEAQDIGVSELRFLAALIGDQPNGLFFAGDLGQRIFQAPFSWSSLGVSVRGRSATLRINYRTSHQIRAQADRLLSPEVSDVDGNVERRDDAQSVFNGPEPIFYQADDERSEANFIGEWIGKRLAAGIEAKQIAIFVRSTGQFDRARAAVAAAGQQVCELDEKLKLRDGCVTMSTMHLAKGLEFRAVAVMAVDEDVIPDPARIEATADLSQLPDLYETERHLLYVACTRARDELVITCAGEGSEFLGDLEGSTL